MAVFRIALCKAPDLQVYSRWIPEGRGKPFFHGMYRQVTVEEVRSTNPYTRVYIADYDDDREDQLEKLYDAEERGSASDMHVIY